MPMPNSKLVLITDTNGMKKPNEGFSDILVPARSDLFAKVHRPDNMGVSNRLNHFTCIPKVQLPLMAIRIFN